MARGFTLVEVLVTLVLASMVALLSHALFAQAAEGLRRAAESRTSGAREANARRMLSAALGSIALADTDAGEFTGHGDRLSFGAWISAGTRLPLVKRLTIGTEDGKPVINGFGGISLPFADSGAIAFDYLLEPGAAERWVAYWISRTSPPAVVRIRVARRGGSDTLLFALGFGG
jgi:prepilin-type N-terminal cleavage/methylation domain-containing protein